MSEQSFNPDQYKAGQKKQWDSVAAGWDKWWPTIEGFSQPVSDRLIELAIVEPGQTVLDVATGVGEPALTAARKIGPGGKVIATDHSEGMLQIAKRRAADAGLFNMEFRGIDGGGLDFGEGTFDAAFCRWGLMFMPDLEEALVAILRALKPGGKFVSAIWGPSEKVPGLSLAIGVVQKVLDLPPPPPEAPNMFKLGSPGAIDAAVTKAGFNDVSTESMIVNFEYDSAEECTEFFKDVAAPIRLMLAEKPDEEANDVWAAITAETAKRARPEGSVSMPSETLITVGRK